MIKVKIRKGRHIRIVCTSEAHVTGSAALPPVHVGALSQCTTATGQDSDQCGLLSQLENVSSHL